MIRRASVLTLVVTLSLIGIPFPAHAADGDSRPLTFKGQPLSKLVNGSAVRNPWALAVLWPQADGQISGVLQDEDGQSLAGQRVELSRPSSERRGRLSVPTDSRGAFSFVGLGPGRYEVQYRVDGEVVATSGPLDLAAGAMQVSGIVFNYPVPVGGLPRGAKIGIGVGIAVVALYVGLLLLVCANEC